ncbi:MAG: hypothetical protein LUH03_06025 [Oscillospiraceae bacterium]|nr:hypothetical protein [Oscillospiraceae bacterium]
MKKVLSIALAIVMVLSVSVVAFADDLYLWDEDTVFFYPLDGWQQYELESGTMTEFIEALQTEGARLVITKDTETHIQYEDGGAYEKFAVLNSWWQGVDVESGLQFVFLGTAGHTSEMETGNGIIDCVYDDGMTVMWDGAEVAEALVAGGFNVDGANVIIVNNCSEDKAYNIINVSIVVPETTEEEAVEDVNASEETTEEASESTETSTASSPDTGVALALVPMAIAGIAVVSSKRR